MDVLGLKKSTSLKFYKKELIKAQITENTIPQKIRSIGIIADVKLFESYDFTKNLADNLGISDESFQLILFCEDPARYAEAFKFPLFSNRDFKMFGKLRSEPVIAFAKKPFDLLINYCNADNLYANILTIRSKSGFKAGFFGENDPIYTFNVQVPADKIDIFNEELVKYLAILKLL